VEVIGSAPPSAVGDDHSVRSSTQASSSRSIEASTSRAPDSRLLGGGVAGGDRLQEGLARHRPRALGVADEEGLGEEPALGLDVERGARRAEGLEKRRDPLLEPLDRE
jgi:hypothetical protein